MTRKSEKSDWISLRAAAEILGVHPATVRNWADRGDIPSRRTPGGHRRFRRQDLEQWVESRQSPPPAEVQMLVQNMLGQTRMRISDGDMRRLTWYENMDEEARETLRQKGRLILETLQNYLAEPPDSPEKSRQVRELGEDYAQFLIDQGLSLTQAMEGFLFFDDFLHESALNIAGLTSARASTEWLTLLRQVRSFSNEMLRYLTQIYESQE